MTGSGCRHGATFPPSTIFGTQPKFYARSIASATGAQIGSYLSGGGDSSAVTGLLAEAAPCLAFTVSFGESKPAVMGHTESAWRWNRRTDFSSPR